MAEDVVAILERLLAAPFPDAPEPPHPHYAWDFYCEFLVSNPRRLVQIVDADYEDPQHAEPGEEPDAIDVELRYRDLFAQTVAAMEAKFGHALKPDLDQIAWSRFDETFFNFDMHDLACWPVNGRLAIVHFAFQFGDDDFQTSVVVCAVPDDRA